MIKQTILKYLHYAINKKHYYIYIFNKQTTLYYLLYTINKQTIINLLYAINKQSILYVYHIININISSCLFVFKCCFKSLQKYNIYNGVVNPWAKCNDVRKNLKPSWVVAKIRLTHRTLFQVISNVL